ncbi:hypothetical protein MHI37_23740 [Paenibacillus sp. FSL H8-0548]|uniref:hypothetical protein n=1 Tax=Paenibacillus sp. FSL H8-0548 TaxID=1920422 RepID=UPI00096F0096|nr:hypothetical protein [Paenibacillus sp. FSL H8-0548]
MLQEMPAPKDAGISYIRNQNYKKYFEGYLVWKKGDSSINAASSLAPFKEFVLVEHDLFIEQKEEMGPKLRDYAAMTGALRFMMGIAIFANR